MAKIKNTAPAKQIHHQCNTALSSLDDTLYVIGGKWRIKILVALRELGNMRFNELQRAVKGISARMLSAELKALELNGFIKRNIDTKAAVTVEYELTKYSDSLNDVLKAMIEWGQKHRSKIRRDWQSSSAK